ncbi:MAG: septum formation inhibitor Maf [Methylococcales bacterium]|jgi:septum formation protein|nr:septum formation inhibitor Maf [Methylococcales bacterium]MBT7442578.1 septum formation inhibitor Maf [Methylococcales bacterium]
MIKLLLASQSPRRKQLLAQLGVVVETVSPDIDEAPLPNELPYLYVARMSEAKAAKGLEMSQSTLPVIASDTSVCVDEHILGKPEDKADGIKMLTMLSGRKHQVMTSVTLLNNGQAQTMVSVSDVWFTVLSKADKDAYWETGEPLDKAGGYAIQGLAARYITRLEGSYSGVMGLPLFETSELLKGLNSHET